MIRGGQLQVLAYPMRQIQWRVIAAGALTLALVTRANASGSLRTQHANDKTTTE